MAISGIRGVEVRARLTCTKDDCSNQTETFVQLGRGEVSVVGLETEDGWKVKQVKKDNERYVMKECRAFCPECLSG